MMFHSWELENVHILHTVLLKRHPVSEVFPMLQGHTLSLTNSSTFTIITVKS